MLHYSTIVKPIAECRRIQFWIVNLGKTGVYCSERNVIDFSRNQSFFDDIHSVFFILHHITQCFDFISQPV